MAKFEKISLPIELIELEDKSFHILVKAEINGHSGDMIIDTGASVTVIDKNLLQGIEEEEEILNIKSGGISGDIDEVKIIKIDSLRFAGYEFDEKKMATINMDYINNLYEQTLQRRIIGLLGSDFCVKYKAVINYEKRTLTVKVKQN